MSEPAPAAHLLGRQQISLGFGAIGEPNLLSVEEQRDLVLDVERAPLTVVRK